MHPVNIIKVPIICGIVYFVSAAPSTSEGHVAPTFVILSTTHKSSDEVRPAAINAEHKNASSEISSDLLEHQSGGPRFLSDTITNGDLSDNEAYYIGVILLVNAIVFFGVIFYLLAPWTRTCSWFGNCKHNYPTGLGLTMEDAARMMTTFNGYDHRLSKRSLEYFTPILKTIAEAYDKYERSSSVEEM